MLVDAAGLFNLIRCPCPVDFPIQGVGPELSFIIWKKREDVAKQRKPFDESIHVEMFKLATKARKDSLEEVVSNVIAAGKFLGWQAREHSRPSQDKVQ
jgi:hypothetical protein